MARWTHRIVWHPGHFVSAQRAVAALTAQHGRCALLEVRDARLPVSGYNPALRAAPHVQRLLCLTHSDVAHVRRARQQLDAAAARHAAHRFDAVFVCDARQPSHVAALRSAMAATDALWLLGGVPNVGKVRWLTLIDRGTRSPTARGPLSLAGLPFLLCLTSLSQSTG